MTKDLAVLAGVPSWLNTRPFLEKIAQRLEADFISRR